MNVYPVTPTREIAATWNTGENIKTARAIDIIYTYEYNNKYTI